MSSSPGPSSIVDLSVVFPLLERVLSLAVTLNLEEWVMMVVFIAPLLSVSLHVLGILCCCCCRSTTKTDDGLSNLSSVRVDPGNEAMGDEARDYVRRLVEAAKSDLRTDNNKHLEASLAKLNARLDETNAKLDRLTKAMSAKEAQASVPLIKGTTSTQPAKSSDAFLSTSSVDSAGAASASQVPAGARSERGRPSGEGASGKAANGTKSRQQGAFAGTPKTACGSSSARSPAKSGVRL